MSALPLRLQAERMPPFRRSIHVDKAVMVVGIGRRTNGGAGLEPMVPVQDGAFGSNGGGHHGAGEVVG